MNLYLHSIPITIFLAGKFMKEDASSSYASSGTKDTERIVPSQTSIGHPK